MFMSLHDGIPTAWRTSVLVAGLMAASASPAQTPVSGSSAPCEASALTTSGKGPGATLVVCSRASRDAPALQEAIARLNALAARDEDTRRDLQRFGGTLNDMSRRLKAIDVKTFADAVAARIQRGAAQGDGALVNEVDRLRVSMREMNQKLEDLRARPGLQDKTDAAVAGEAGQAIARLDFETARGMLDRLTVLERRVEESQGPYAANAALFEATRNEALERLERVRRDGGPARCAKGWAGLETLRAAAEDTQRQGKVNAAGLAYKELFERAIQIGNEMGVVDSLSRIQQSSAQQRDALQQRSMQQAFEFAGMTFERRRPNALRQVRTDALRAKLAEADAMRTRAAELAQRGQYLEGADLLIDGANLLGRIESEGGNYRIPMQDIPKAHRSMMARQPVIPEPAITEADVMPGGGLCR